MYKCERCGRTLKTSPWKEQGIGRICAQKKRGEEGFKLAQKELEPAFDGSNDIRFLRTYDGLVCNVRQNVVEHSPTGFEIGYPGSGPADLSLNILHVLLPPKGADDVQCYAGVVSRLAWTLHQDMKFDLIATLPRLETGQETTLSIEAVRGWIFRKKSSAEFQKRFSSVEASWQAQTL